MIGRTPAHVVAVRPLKDGVIADFEITERMLRYFIQKVHKRRYFAKPRVVVCVPSGITGVERRAVIEAASQAGARQVHIVGSRWRPRSAPGSRGEATGCMVVDIGGGTTEVAIISLGGIVYAQSVRVGGDKFDEAIIDHVRKVFSLMLGERSAEEIKMALASAVCLENRRLPRSAAATWSPGSRKRSWCHPTDIRDAIEEPIAGDHRRRPGHPRHVPAGARADIMDRGIVLTGGGALLRRMDDRLSTETGMPVIIASEPLDCVALGAGKCVDEFEALQAVMAASQPLPVPLLILTNDSGFDSGRRHMVRDTAATRLALGALLVGAFALAVIDTHAGSGPSPLHPVRSAAASVLSPVQSTMSGVTDPFVRIAGAIGDADDDAQRVAELAAQNVALQAQLRDALAQGADVYSTDALTAAAAATGTNLTVGHVIAMNAVDGYSWTIAVDRGSADGVVVDSTVLDEAGLIGRVVAVSRARLDRPAGGRPDLHRRRADGGHPGDRDAGRHRRRPAPPDPVQPERAHLPGGGTAHLRLAGSQPVPGRAADRAGRRGDEPFRWPGAGGDRASLRAAECALRGRDRDPVRSAR